MARPTPHPSSTGAVPDIRERIFESVLNRRFHAAIIAESAGVISGMARTENLADQLNLDFVSRAADKALVAAGATIATMKGDPLSMVSAEELLLGELSKTSGVATQASRAREIAGNRFRVVCGAFKKMPRVINAQLRQAIVHGGLDMRMAPQPFVYLDKNYIRMLGGFSPAMKAICNLEGPVVMQVRGDFAPIADEAVSATRLGAAILMVDTGNRDDLDAVSQALHRKNLRRQVQLAFAGNLRLTDLKVLGAHDVDAVDIGYSMVDAPCLPMRFDVITDHDREKVDQ